MKKSLIVLGAAAMVAAAAVPALAFENEFHGMFRSYGFVTNAYSAVPAAAASTVPGVAGTAGPGVFLTPDRHTAAYFEQRARIQYIAKASDDLKLVTHFELDSLFGGGSATKYQGTDAGGLDADQVNLETKNVYLDFNVAAPVNVKIGIQPWNDAYQGVFGNFDGTGILATGKFGMVTPSLGWFRVAESAGTAGARFIPGKLSNDLLVVNAKAAVSKDITVGASYYYLTKETNAFSAAAPSALAFHTAGVDAAVKVGPAALTAFGAYQVGEYTNNRDLSAATLGAVAKVKVGPGNVNVSALYLSGDADTGATSNSDYSGWQQLSPGGATSYFSASNMWLLVRNGATINTSSAIGGTDLTKGGRGFIGAFAGFDGAVGKTFFATNLGYGQTAEKRGAEQKDIGYEVNATVGYKLYDSLAVSLNGAYALLGDAVTSQTPITGGTRNAADPYLTFVRVDYTF